MPLTLPPSVVVGQSEVHIPRCARTLSAEAAHQRVGQDAIGGGAGGRRDRVDRQVARGRRRGRPTRAAACRATSALAVDGACTGSRSERRARLATRSVLLSTWFGRRDQRRRPRAGIQAERSNVHWTWHRLGASRGLHLDPRAVPWRRRGVHHQLWPTPLAMSITASLSSRSSCSAIASATDRRSFVPSRALICISLAS